jgi:transcriptional regulator with XRE-family HTH domain
MMDLLAARKAKGLSQTDLALKANVDQRMISSLEMNKQNMSLDFAQKVAPVLGVEVNKLLNNQALSRVMKVQDTAIAAIKAHPDDSSDLEKVIDELAICAKTDPGPVGLAAKSALIRMGNAVLKEAREEAWKEKRDYGGRDTFGRVRKQEAPERDTFGRVRKQEAPVRDSLGRKIKEETA